MGEARKRLSEFLERAAAGRGRYIAQHEHVRLVQGLRDDSAPAQAFGPPWKTSKQTVVNVSYVNLELASTGSFSSLARSSAFKALSQFDDIQIRNKSLLGHPNGHWRMGLRIELPAVN